MVSIIMVFLLHFFKLTKKAIQVEKIISPNLFRLGTLLWNIFLGGKIIPPTAPKNLNILSQNVVLNICCIYPGHSGAHPGFF